MRRMYDLPLHRDHTAIFFASWIAYHPIDGASPLFNATEELLRERSAVVTASLIGIDGSSMQTVHAQHHYLPNQIAWNAGFADIVSKSPMPSQAVVLVDYTRFNEVIRFKPGVLQTGVSQARSSVSEPE